MLFSGTPIAKPILAVGAGLIATAISLLRCVREGRTFSEARKRAMPDLNAKQRRFQALASDGTLDVARAIADLIEQRIIMGVADRESPSQM